MRRRFISPKPNPISNRRLRKARRDTPETSAADGPKKPPVTLADIAEMRARGYDPSSIEEAEREWRRGEGSEPLRQQIKAAFAGVKLGNGVGLWTGQGLDEYADGETMERYRQKDEKEDWSRILTMHLNACYSSLSFFDAEGMRFHLPAFLLADLCGELNAGAGMAFNLTYQLPGRCEDKFTRLSAAQRAAVRAYLRFRLDDPDEDFWHKDIRRALDGYWTAESCER